jgi:hypothetical protein
VQLRKVLDLVSWVCWWWRARGVVDGRLGVLLLAVFLLRLPLGAVMGNCPSGNGSDKESSTSCPPPHTHGNSPLLNCSFVIGRPCFIDDQIISTPQPTVPHPRRMNDRAEATDRR